MNVVHKRVLLGSSDSAFVDRADIVQFIDLPPREAVYEILRGALCEFIDKGILLKIVCTRFL
jgi:pachytene checkpoint protein 2